MTSPIINLKKAAERKLSTLSPSIPTAYEGFEFIAPSSMYLRTQFVIQLPDDPTIGSNYYRERILFQVFICDELNKGTVGAYAVAESIRSLFSKGMTMQESTNNIYVLNTPQISGSMVTNSRLIIPVMINLVVEVFE